MNLLFFQEFFGVIFFVIFSLNSFSQNNDDLKYRDAVFDDNIKSVQLYRDGAVLSTPLRNNFV